MEDENSAAVGESFGAELEGRWVVLAMVSF
jgi:hypothetical protein